MKRKWKGRWKSASFKIPPDQKPCYKCGHQPIGAEDKGGLYLIFCGWCGYRDDTPKFPKESLDKALLNWHRRQLE